MRSLGWVPLLWGWATAAHAGAFPYPVHTQTLDNGLQIVAVPMPSPGVVALGTWMRVGSRDELDAGRTGFAHFFEHLMFLGTPTLPGDVRERRLLRMGADDNAWTWLDETVYHVLAPASALPELVVMEADRFQHLTLTPEQVRREAGAVFGEYRKGLSDPGERLSDALQAEAFKSHTYKHSTIGYEADVLAMPDAHTYAGAFFERHYRPERAMVLVVGDIEPEQALGLVKAAYGPWTAGPAAPAPPAEPPQTGPRRVTVPWEAGAAPRLALGWRIPGSDPANPDVAALDLLDGLLLSEVGPLHRRLVQEEGLAFAVSGGRQDFVDPCLFVVDVELRPSADPAAAVAKAEAIVREEVARLQQAVDGAALERVRTHRRSAFLSSLDDPLDVLMALGWAARRGGVGAIDTFYERFDAVQAADVQAVAGRYLVDTGLTVAVLASEEAP